jgi:hypothetical protein
VEEGGGLLNSRVAVAPVLVSVLILLSVPLSVLFLIVMGRGVCVMHSVQTELWSTVFSAGEYHDAASGVRVLPMSKTSSCGCCAFSATLIGGEGFQCLDDYNSLPDNIKTELS